VGAARAQARRRDPRGTRQPAAAHRSMTYVMARSGRAALTTGDDGL
jgi:hypothetical protein